MRIENIEATTFTIFDAPKLDPVTVVLQDVGAGCGRLMVECYGDAWAAYWGAMGSEKVRDFVATCDAGYIANKLWRGNERRTKSGEAYLLRIVEAVQTALTHNVALSGAPQFGASSARSART